MRLVNAELLKIRTAPRTTVALVLALVAIVALGSASTASSADGSPFSAEIATADVLEIVSTASFFTLIIGILIVTWEHRHGTITPTFLITPRRERVLGAKLVAAGAAAVVLTLLAIVVAFGLALIWIDLDLDGATWELMGRLLFGGVAWAVLGVGLGAVLRSQVGALVLALVWFMIAEPILGAAIDQLVDGSDYLPGSALDRFFAGEEATVDGFGFAEEEPAFGVWAAAALVTGYAAAAAVAGGLVSDRRDVT